MFAGGGYGVLKIDTDKARQKAICGYIGSPRYVNRTTRKAKMVDRAAASELGCSVAAICRARKSEGIAPARTGGKKGTRAIDWERDYFNNPRFVDKVRARAETGDAYIATELGCSLATVQKRRRERGVAAYCRYGYGVNWQYENGEHGFWNIETKRPLMSDQSVARILGVPARIVCKAREKRGISRHPDDGERGVVYLIRQRSRKEPWVKIGKSDSLEGARGRLRDGQCWNPRPLKLHLVVEVPDVFGAETALHRRFKKHNGHGEWFDLSDERLVEARAFLVDEYGGKILYGQRGFVNAT